jgi:hypothetical protein
MKNYLHLLLLLIFTFSLGYTHSQNITLEIPIIQNGEMVTDTLENGAIVTFGLSSDDAEQEQDEMDTLHDDDLDAGWEGAPEDQLILTAGLRFQNVSVPKGAVIESAYIQVTSHEAKAAEDVAEITIVGHKQANAPTFTMDQLITDRPETTASVEWTVAEEWGLWTTHQTADISSVIQEIINMDGWIYGNSLVIIMKGKNQGLSDYENAREFEAFENIADPEDGGDGQNHPERVPKLVIEYSYEDTVLEIPIVQNGDFVTDTLENGTIVTFGLSSDDAEQEHDEMDTLFDDDLDAGWEGAPEDQLILTTGLRFQEVTIPKGVTIKSAHMILCSHEAKSALDVAEITIAAEASDNASTFSMDQLITDRPQTEAKVEWVVSEEWGLWTYHQTADFAPVIQEIIDRDGWQSGNSIALLMIGKDQGLSDYENAREFEAFENIADPEDGGDGQNHPERVPKLVINYSGAQSVGEISTRKTLHIYPNPATMRQITIELESDEPAVITVLDGSGREVINMLTSRSEQVHLDLSKMPAGIYGIHAIQNKTIFTQKLILK